MRKDEVYGAWSPDEGAWSDWVKPVLFASMAAEVATKPWEYADWVLEPELLAPLGGLGNVVAVVDLPGRSGVEVGLQLGTFGLRPIPLYNAIPAPGGFVKLAGIMTALVDGADTVAELPTQAPPAFLLDSLRMVRQRRDGAHPRYDNRWVVRATDFPSLSALRAAGIERVLLVQSTADRPLPDLEPVVLDWQRAGLELWRLAESPAGPARPQPMAPRPWYQRLRSWLDTSRFQPRSDGSFGHFYVQGG